MMAKALSIFYEIDDDTPDLDNVLVGAGATSSEITLSGLSAFTTYTLYAWTYNNGTFSVFWMIMSLRPIH